MIGTWLTAERIFSAAMDTCSSGQFANTMPKRSPPTRPITSLTRRQRSRRWPTATITASAASWPSASLTAVSLSMPTARYAPTLPERRLGGAVGASDSRRPFLLKCPGGPAVLAGGSGAGSGALRLVGGAVDGEGGGGGMEGGGAAIVDPGEAAVLGTHAIFAIEGDAARPMRIEALLTKQQIVGIETTGERAAGRNHLRIGDAEHRRG